MHSYTKSGLLVCSTVDMFQRICGSEKKWGLYLSFDTSFGPLALHRSCPFLDAHLHWEVFCKGNAALFFDSEGEMRYHYDQVIGDDGPTKLNDYDGPGCVYALTCGPDGNFLTENT